MKKKIISLSRAEMRMINGGGGICPDGLCWNPVNQTCDYIFNGEDCADTITCRIVAKSEPANCGTGAYITMPSSQNPYAWCAAQPCCAEIFC